MDSRIRTTLFRIPKTFARWQETLCSCHTISCHRVLFENRWQEIQPRKWHAVAKSSPQQYDEAFQFAPFFCPLRKSKKEQSQRLFQPDINQNSSLFFPAKLACRHHSSSEAIDRKQRLNAPNFGGDSQLRKGVITPMWNFPTWKPLYICLAQNRIRRSWRNGSMQGAFPFPEFTGK